MHSHVLVDRQVLSNTDATRIIWDGLDCWIIWFFNLPLLKVLDEGYYSNVPDEGYYSNVPDEGYYVPDEGY
jgi:hypothetical protein